MLRVAVEALRILLGRAQLNAVMKPLDQEGAWDKMKDPQQHTTGVTLLSRYTHLFSIIPQSSWIVCCFADFSALFYFSDQLQHFESASRRFQALVTAYGLMQFVCGNSVQSNKNKSLKLTHCFLSHCGKIKCGLLRY